MLPVAGFLVVVVGMELALMVVDVSAEPADDEETGTKVIFGAASRLAANGCGCW